MQIFTTLLTEPLANGLILFYNLLFQNMGLAIIAFTGFLILILNPLTKPYMESMKQMKKYQADLDKLKAKHGKDKVKYSQAQSDFFREKGIKNPSAGCVPYLLQFAILIAFFRLFINVFQNGALVESFNSYLYTPLKFAASDTINTSFLYLDVSQPDTFALSALPFALPGPILLLAAAVQFISAKITQPYIEAEKKLAKKTPEKSDDVMANMQGYMIYTFPLMTLWFGSRFPSGLALYWLVFSGAQAYKQYRGSGWGALTPWLVRAGLVQLPSNNGNSRKRRKNSNK